MRSEPYRPFFKIENLLVRFGGVVAVNHVNLEVREGEIHALIGPNGAGKTTIFNAISGIHRPDRGSIFFRGVDLVKLKPYEISRKGISRTFQNVELFSKMTVLENIKVGMHTFVRSGFLASALSLRKAARAEREAEERSMEILRSLELHPYSRSTATDLPFGQQRLLELGRALAAEPKLLLLDEPAAGMNQAEIKTLNRLLLMIREKWRVTILLVEHVMKLVMEISDSITVLNFGEKIAEGDPGEIKNNPDVITAYLGKEKPIARNLGR